MHQIANSDKANNQANLLDRAIQGRMLKNDAALSRLLGVAPPVISKMRSGKLKIGATMLINLHEKTGMGIKEMKAICGGTE